MISEWDEGGKKAVVAYALAQSLDRGYPRECDAMEMWDGNWTKDQWRELKSLSFAFIYAFNHCLECEIPKDHPQEGVSRTYVRNPLSPGQHSFFDKYMRDEAGSNDLAKCLVGATDEIYAAWDTWLWNNGGYSAKAELPIYYHSANRVPTKTWGILQIEKELKLMARPVSLMPAFEMRNALLNQVRKRLVELLTESGYWD